MRIGIIGAGSIGLLLASYLKKNHSIHIYSKSIQIENDTSIKEIKLYHNNKIFTSSVLFYKNLSDLSVDVLFICVKQNHLPEVIKSIIRYQTDTPLILIQNGLTHLHYQNELRQAVMVGVVEQGAKRLTQLEVKHNGQGRIVLSSRHDPEKANVFAHELHQHNFPFESSDMILNLMHQKLIANAVINPITALFQVKNKYIIKNEHIRKIALKLSQEASEALGFDDELMWDYVKSIAQKTGENTSSMLQDILNQQKTEIESISGYIIHISKVERPYTSFIYHAIRALEER